MENQRHSELAQAETPALAVIRRRKGLVIVIGLAGALSGFAITRLQTPIYQARTSIEIVGVNDNFLNTKQVKPVTDSGSTSETADLQTQIRILLSDSLLARVFDRLMREIAPEPAVSGLVSAWRHALHLPAPSRAGLNEDALKTARKAVKVRTTGLARVLEITADSTDPRAAADFANALANEFIEQNLETRRKSTESTREWLTEQIEDMRAKLERSEENLQAYARQSGLEFTTDRNSASEEDLNRLRQSVSAAQVDRITKQSHYEMTLSSTPETFPDALSDESLRGHQTKLAELRRQMAELIAVYTAEHSKAQRVQAQIWSLEFTIQQERAAIIKRIADEYEEAKRKEKLLRNAYFEQAQQVREESEKSVRYQILKREVDSNRQLYETMLGQSKQSSVAAAMRASNVRIVDPARIPTRPYKPDVLAGSGLGLATGTFLGIALVIARDRADRSIRQPGEAPAYLGVPELGVIPSGESESLWRRLIACQTHLLPKALAGFLPAYQPAPQRVELITWQRKSSMAAESFRSTVMSILFSSKGGSLPKVLVVTSAGPSEGKSTVVSNLGIAIAELGHRILLIDADLRKPRLHEIFGMPNERGLSNILHERKTAAALDGLIRKTEAPGLFVLTSGPRAAVSTSLLYGSQLPELLKRLRGEFDTMLIDTPPMAQLPDARVIGRLADNVILALRCGKTGRDALLAAKQRFSEDGIRILGTILNDWNPDASANRSHDHYHSSFQSFRKHYASRSAHA